MVPSLGKSGCASVGAPVRVYERGRGAREGDGIALCGNAFAMRAWAPWVRGGEGGIHPRGGPQGLLGPVGRGSGGGRDPQGHRGVYPISGMLKRKLYEGEVC
jgi:hypothetical protein